MSEEGSYDPVLLLEGIQVPIVTLDQSAMVFEVLKAHIQKMPSFRSGK